MKWDLSDLYSSFKDPNIDKDINSAVKLAQNFCENYKSNLKTLSVSDFLNCLKEYSDILELSSKLGFFAQLKFSEDSTSNEAKSLMQRIEEADVNISRYLLFFTLEYSKLTLKKKKEFELSSELQPYRNYLKRVNDFSKFNLSEAEEKILNEKSLTSTAAFTRLFEQIISRQEFSIEIEGEIKKFTESEILELIRKPDRNLRKNASKCFTEGLKNISEDIGFILNTLILDDKIEDDIRKVPSIGYTRHLQNQLSPEIVENLVSAVSENYSLVARYYNLKRKLLGLDELFEYDRYAPLNESDAHYSFEEGKDMILKSFRDFSTEFYNIAKVFFDKNWIDSEVRKGKRGGAFCMMGTPKLHGYVLTNYLGNDEDILTLAHELGHGIHGELSRKKFPILTSHAPLVTAETASVFGENIVFENLYAKADKDEKISLLTNYIEASIATIFRQISMYKFELALHSARRAQGELNISKINSLWRETQVEMFSNSVTFTPDYDNWWVYITHFFESPFYVYAYAFGSLLVLSLFAEYKKNKEDFLPKYMNILSAGDSVPVQELLSQNGIDISKKSFWVEGIKILESKVEELEKLVK